MTIRILTIVCYHASSTKLIPREPYDCALVAQNFVRCALFDAGGLTNKNPPPVKGAGLGNTKPRLVAFPAH